MATRLSQEARERALQDKLPLPTEVPVNYHIIGKLMESMAEAILHQADNSYLAKSGLHDPVCRPLRVLPIESKRLFADRMVEAIDLNWEEMKAQSSRKSGQKQQYQKPQPSSAKQSSGSSYSGSTSGSSSRNQSKWGKSSRGGWFPRGCGDSRSSNGRKP